MIPAWIELIRNRFARRKHDFVSVDAKRFSTNGRPYEIITSPPQSTYTPKVPEAAVTSPSLDGDTIAALSPPKQNDYFTRDAKYVSPAMSFSTPRPPSSGRCQGREWDPVNTYARPWSPTTGKSGMI